MSGEYRWYVGNGEEPDNYIDGPFETREEAVLVGSRDYPEGYSIIEAFKGAFSPPSAETLMGQFLETWCDDDMGREEYPEFEGSPAAIKAAEHDLDSLLTAWFARHRKIMPTPWGFAAHRNYQFFPGEKDRPHD